MTRTRFHLPIRLFHSLLFIRILCPLPLEANLELSPFVSSHMVIQREREISIPGRSVAGAAILASLESNEQKYETATRADAKGEFTLHFDPLPAGGPYRLVVQDESTSVVFDDIMLGDLWICAGQSNMQFPVAEAEGGEEALAEADKTDIRLFTMEARTALHRTDEVAGGPWEVASAHSAREFSAVGYFFARELRRHTSIPIGLIDTSWGGTPAEVWIDPETLAREPDLAHFHDSMVSRTAAARLLAARIDTLLGTLPPPDPSRPLSASVRSDGIPRAPGICYNAMIHPLTRFPVKGVIWYQGEANWDRPAEYRHLFPTLIRDWRRAWREADLPFYFVQLASYRLPEDGPDQNAWAGLREAQESALSLPATGMALAIDLGEADDIHPRNKAEVGRRLSLLALAESYQLPIDETSGPTLKSAVPDDFVMILNFDHAEGGLVLHSPSESAFQLAGEDGIFHPAKATVDGTTIRLTAADVPHPIHVRYAWANNPSTPLYNRAGLPARPFRTDQFPLPFEERRFESILAGLEETSRHAFLQAPSWLDLRGLRVAASAEQEGNPISAAFDGDFSTRWSAKGLGVQLLVDLGETTTCEEIKLAFYRGEKRHAILRVETAPDLDDWSETFFGLSSGKSDGLESFPAGDLPFRYLLITFFGTTDGFWNSLSELALSPPRQDPQ